jgi:hypothetical protein
MGWAAQPQLHCFVYRRNARSDILCDGTNVSLILCPCGRCGPTIVGEEISSTHTSGVRPSRASQAGINSERWPGSVVGRTTLPSPTPGLVDGRYTRTRPRAFRVRKHVCALYLHFFSKHQERSLWQVTLPQRTPGTGLHDWPAPLFCDFSQFIVRSYRHGMANCLQHGKVRNRIRVSRTITQVPAILGCH